MGQQEELAIRGLQKLDASELKSAIPEAELVPDEQAGEVAAGTRHEPLTIIALVALSSQAIAAVAAWLLKKRHRRELRLEVEVRHPDGTTERKTLVFELSESSTQEEVVRALGEQIGLSAQMINQALAGGPSWH